MFTGLRRVHLDKYYNTPFAFLLLLTHLCRSTLSRVLMKCFEMRKCLLIIGLIGFTNVYGQWKEYTPVGYQLKDSLNYNLKDYVNPEYHYREFEALFHFTGDFSRRSSDSYSYSDKSNSNSLSPDISFSSFSLHNTLHRQQQTSWQLLGGFNAWNTSREYDGYKTTVNTFSGGVNLNFDNQIRFYRGNRYLGIGLNSYLSYKRESSESELSGLSLSGNEDRSTFVGLFVQPEISIGLGRIEETSNAWLAVHLLRALQRNNRLVVLPTTQDIKDLSDLVARLRNSRSFDNRYRLVSDLTALDSALHVAGLISTADISAFSAINDVWIYSNRPGRLSGNRFYLGVSPGITWSHLDSKAISRVAIEDTVTVDSVNEDNFLNFDLIAGFICEKPINMEWQRSFSVNARGGLRTTETTSQYEAGLSPFALLSTLFGYGYYPDTRTSIKFSVKGNIEWQSVKSGDEPLGSHSEKFELEELNWNLGANTVFQYYLSPSLRFNLNASINYDTNHQTANMEYQVSGYRPALQDITIDDKLFSLSYSASVVYMIW